MYNHQEAEFYEIGSLESTDSILLIEDAIGRRSFSKLGELKILVYTNEGTIPHFHLKSSSSNWETCIELLKPKYFHYGKKNKVLNSKQCRELDDFMRSPNKIYDILSNWKACLFLWSIGNNYSIIITKDIKYPGYIDIKT